MRRLKAPWSAQKTEGGYRVRDSHGRTLCYIYCRDDEKNAEIANVLTWDEGRRVAANIAKLPGVAEGSRQVGRQQNSLPKTPPPFSPRVRHPQSLSETKLCDNWGDFRLSLILRR